MAQTGAKPFIKWVGGKGQLIGQLEGLLPGDIDRRGGITYIEPFIGGGAMLFHMLKTHKSITKAIINNINQDLTTCYKTVRDAPDQLLNALRDIQKEYYSLPNIEAKREMFFKKREQYNQKAANDIENTTLFFFLNRTCFNGLYRVNKKGHFNVPFGRYENPTICDEQTILADSELLKRVEILCGDFTQTLASAAGNSFFYFDPPYRPLSATSNFNDYAKEAFNDDSQIRLKKFCDLINEAGHQFLLSNSDDMTEGKPLGFFDELYNEYLRERVLAARNVNSNGSGRGKIKEITIRNYANTINSANILNFK